MQAIIHFMAGVAIVSEADERRGGEQRGTGPVRLATFGAIFGRRSTHWTLVRRAEKMAVSDGDLVDRRKAGGR